MFYHRILPNITLGLLLVRQKNHSQALPYLERATQSPSATVRYFYVYAVALNSIGQQQKSIEVLQLASSQFPNDADIHSALQSFKQQQNQAKEPLKNHD